MFFFDLNKFSFSIPDMQYIGEIKLFANGFINAKILAKKMVTLYRYASELLSKQVIENWLKLQEKSCLILVSLWLGFKKF